MKIKPLVVSSNRRYLTTRDGSPFFYLGETAWELFHRCTREDAELLLSDRAAKGFTVIQAVALAELDGLNTPNSYGHRPFVDNDPARPVEEYWSHVDWIVRRTNEHGMYVGLLPTWGDKWKEGNGAGPLIFTEQNARAYGAWLGKRYRDAGLIWILGGDRPITTEAEGAIVRAMAEGLAEGDGGAHLRTFHPPGNNTSSRFVHHESWIDFHMQQTGHDRDRRSWEFAERDWDLLPHRPFVNGEPPYEAHPNAFRGGDFGWLDQADVRRELYWAICGGAAGFTYGCHAIWQMYEAPRRPINGPRSPWKESLSLPGGAQVQYGARLALSRPFLDREPATRALVKGPDASGTDAIRACRGADRSWAFVYLPNCQRVRVALSELAGERVHATCYNPRSGASVDLGTVAGGGEESFQPPFDPDGRDWVLILDDAARGYPAP